MKTALQRKKIGVNADSQISNVGAVSTSRVVTNGQGLWLCWPFDSGSRRNKWRILVERK